MHESSSDVRTLLQHRDFIRRVAAGVLACPAAVDDVEQETLSRALQSPPRTPALAAFLGRIARNLSLNRSREERRRARRESDGARPEALPSAADQVQRLELARRLVDSLASLPEAQRQAIVLRYYEDRPPREIATELGVPVETVRTRIKTGLGRLRRELRADDDGSRRALALLVARWSPEAGAAIGGLGGWGSAMAAAGLIATVTWIGVSCSTGGGASGGASASPGPQDGDHARGERGVAEPVPQRLLKDIGYVDEGSLDAAPAESEVEEDSRESRLRSLGYLEKGAVDEGAADEAAVDGGAMDEGAADEGTVEDAEVDEEPPAVEDGSGRASSSEAEPLESRGSHPEGTMMERLRRLGYVVDEGDKAPPREDQPPADDGVPPPSAPIL